MIGKRLDVFLLLLTIIAACLIVIVADASPVSDSNDVAAWEEEGSLTVATPAVAAAGSPDYDRCCLGVIKPIVLTAKPRYKYVVVPPLSIT
uniref:Putative secreted protein n=1 Tax=Anopheles darlingi TaxID=43151 RepID=A0A2M4DQG1_ANODA